MYDIIIVGSGYAGAVCARHLAEHLGRKVLLLEERPHIAGNMYDYKNEKGVLIHKYGPHICVMNEERVFNYLSCFTEWVSYHHHVNVLIDGVEVPLPINFTSVDRLLPVEEAIQLKHTLTQEYGEGSNITVLDMLESANKDVAQFAEYIYEKVFLHYTQKMWGLSPSEIDPSVTGRIPVRLSYDCKHFLHKYQVMPSEGYTRLFENMLNHPNIQIWTSTASEEVLRFDEPSGEISFNNKLYQGQVVYTGALDRFFQFDLGELPYRSLYFEHDTRYQNYIQETAVLNWPDERPATRRTEMKRLTGQIIDNVTSTITEYPGKFSRDSHLYNEPYYPIIKDENHALFLQYLGRCKKFDQLLTLGRLADYKYYNMEATILRAFEVLDSMGLKKDQGMV